MSDPIVISASILILFSITTTIASVTNQLYVSAKSAPQSVRQIQKDMDEMKRVVVLVQLLHDAGIRTTRANPSRLSSICIDQLMAKLTECVSLCSMLDAKLEDVSSLRGTDNRQITRSKFSELIRWTFKVRFEAQDLVEDLNRHKFGLNLILSITQYYNSCDTSTGLVQLHNIVGRVPESSHEILTELRELKHDLNPTQQIQSVGEINMDNSTSEEAKITSTAAATIMSPAANPLALPPSIPISPSPGSQSGGYGDTRASTH